MYDIIATTIGVTPRPMASDIPAYSTATKMTSATGVPKNQDSKVIESAFAVSLGLVL